MAVDVPEKYSESDLSDSTINHWRVCLNTMEDTKVCCLFKLLILFQSHLLSQVKAYRNNILVLWAELTVEPADNFELSVLENTCGCTVDTIGKLESKFEGLKAEKSRREEIIQDLAKKITTLWDMMGVSDEDRNYFFAMNTTLGLKDIEAVSLTKSLLIPLV